MARAIRGAGTGTDMRFKLQQLFLVAALLLSLPSSFLLGQRSLNLPNDRYYTTLPAYYQGEYDRALRSFRSGASSAYQDGNGRFMDSICFWTMAGECYYQMGEYALAIENYEAAIRLYIDFRSWPSRTQFPTTVQASATAVSKARITWGTSERPTTIGNFPNRMSVMLGDLLAAERALQQGGLASNPMLRPVDIGEVMRCTALAIYRRNQIKGPTCKHDPLTRDMVARLSSGRAGTISGSWQGVVSALALSSAGQYDKAAIKLNQCLQISRFDHPLTPIALLELGNIAAVKKDWATAQKYYMEASYSGAIFQQYDVISDALHGATVVQMIADRSTVFSPLVEAAVWANREKARSLHASLIGDAIWSAAESGAPEEALVFIKENSRVLRRGELAESTIGTQWLYCSALANSMVGDSKAASRDLERFVAAARRSSKWLYQISLADELVVNSRVQPRTADLLYSELLRDPDKDDWIIRPMETIAFLVSPHVEPMTRWYGIAVTLKDELKALEISDLVRRHKFYGSLPLGGRQLALRWIAAAPREALSDEAQKQQTDLLTRYPILKQLNERSTVLLNELRKLPSVPEKGSDELRNQKELLDELADVTSAAELLLQSIALRREPCELAFPPQKPVTTIQESLEEDQMVITVFYAHNQYFINMISKNGYSLESMVQADLVEKTLAKLIIEMGLAEPGGTTTADKLNDDWREAANELSALLFPRTDPAIFSRYREIIFVPDGALWYFPFELIQLGNESGGSRNLVDDLDIRYAPTISTAISDKRTPRRFGKSLVVTGRTNIRDDSDLSVDAFEQFKAQIAGAESVDKSSKVPSSILAAIVDQIVVWAEIDPVKKTNLTISPMQYDSGRAGGALGNWLGLPWTGVDQIILPGFKSAGTGSKKIRARGEELFLTTCTLLATGTKSILISRWPVGGQSTIDLTREFAAESLNSSPTKALRRSIQLLKDSELDLQVEPRIRETRLQQPLKGDHPTFWSSYLLIDLTSRPAKENEGEDPDGADENAEGEEKQADK